MPAIEAPTRSPSCTTDDHGQCGHYLGSGVAIRVVRRRLEPYEILCQCTCHARCPLSGEERVPPSVWDQQCTCAGSDQRREFHRRREHESDDRSRRLRAAMAEVDVGHGRSKADLKADYAGAFQRHGVVVSDVVVDTAAEAVSAATGPRSLVLPRLGLLGGRLTGKGVRFLREHRRGDGAG